MRLSPSRKKPFYSPEAKIYACVVPGSGHDISLALNHEIQVADSVLRSIGFVGQRGFDKDDDGSASRRLPQNRG